MAEKKAHVSDEKKKIVKEYTELLKKYPIIGIVNMEKLPCAQLQRIKGKIRDVALIRMTKKRLMRIAIENAKKDVKGIEKLEEHFKGMPALLFTKENPFTLFKIIKRNKSKAAAKPGDIAPRDIIIKAGPTPFAPGPIISELGSMGIVAGVEDGKVAVKKDTVVAKKGEPIKQTVAGLLPKFGIEPMEVGIDVVAVFEKGEILTKDVLDIDEEAYINNLTAAASESFALAMETGILTKETTEIIITNMANEALALAMETNILTDETAKEVLAKAEAQASALKSIAQK